jgi:hypothetical protein
MLYCCSIGVKVAVEYREQNYAACISRGTSTSTGAFEMSLQLCEQSYFITKCKISMIIFLGHVGHPVWQLSISFL